MSRFLFPILIMAAVLLQSCGGGGGGSAGTQQSGGGTPTPLGVDASSFINKGDNGALVLVNYAVPKLSLIPGTAAAWDGYESLPDTLAVADFFQLGKYSAFVVGSKTGATPKARGYFLKFDTALGKWVDDSSSIFASNADRDACDDPRQALVTKFNADEIPDVYLVCAGGGTTGVRQILYISSGTGGKYVKYETTFQADATSASIAKWDDDANVDIVTTHGGVVYRVMGTGGFGAANWLSQKDAVLTWAGKSFPSTTNSVHLIPRDGQVYLLVGGYGTNQNTIVWYKTDKGFMIENSYRSILISTNQPEYKFDYVEYDQTGYLYALKSATSDYAGLYWIERPFYDGTTIASANLHTFRGTPTYATPPSWASRVVVKKPGQFPTLTMYDAGCLSNPVQTNDQRCGQVYTLDPASF